MGFFFGYYLFLVLFISGNGAEALFDLSNPISFLNILLLGALFGAVLLGGHWPEEGDEERRRRIQEEGRRLKERYRQTMSGKDLIAWAEWCQKFNGGREN